MADVKENGKGSLAIAFMPNKANVIGTVLLLVANYAGGFVSRLALSLLRGPAADGVQAAGRTFAGGAGGQFAGGAGLVGAALGAVVLAVLFYAVISFTMGVLAEK